MWIFGRGFHDSHCSADTASAYIDGALGRRQTERVETHLLACHACRQHVEELRSVVGVLRMTPTEPAPRSFAVPVPAPAFAYAAAPVGRVRWQPTPVMGLRAAAVAAALALAVVFAGDYSGMIGTPEAPIQVGRVATTDLVTPGNPPGPEPSQVLGASPVTAADGGAAAVTGVDTSAGTGPTLARDGARHLELLPLQLGLLALTVVLIVGAYAFRRRA